jgi:hypothetical protein
MACATVRGLAGAWYVVPFFPCKLHPPLYVLLPSNLQCPLCARRLSLLRAGRN